MGYFFGRLCWLFLASYLEMPVSTTHSCVGGMIGMAMILKGNDCVIWVNLLILSHMLVE